MSNNQQFNLCKSISSFIEEKVSFTFWRKKIFLMKYLIRNILQYIAKKIYFIIFMAIPVLIYAVLFVPVLFNRYPVFFDIPKSLPHIYTVEGEVKNQTKKNLANVSIDIGGFHTETNEKGKFKLTFLSK